jgi:hypothetical protein
MVKTSTEDATMTETHVFWTLSTLAAVAWVVAELLA